MNVVACFPLDTTNKGQSLTVEVEDKRSQSQLIRAVVVKVDGVVPRWATATTIAFTR